MSPVGSLAELERYYDAAPRSAARVEEVGAFSVFVGTGSWPYHARPRLGVPHEFTVADIGTGEVARVYARLGFRRVGTACIVG